MNWNIFKRIAELETRVATLTMLLIGHNAAMEILPREEVKPETPAVSKKRGRPRLAEAEKKRRQSESKRKYYAHNKERLLAQRKAKYQEDRRKAKERAYAKQYYAKKRADMLNQNKFTLSA